MFNIVTGGAGFLGSHLVNALVDDGEDVLIVDDLTTGHVRNVEYALSSGRATFAYAELLNSAGQLLELVLKRRVKVDRIYHVASLSGPRQAAVAPWDGLVTTAMSCLSVIELALQLGSRVLFASSAEVYGDPLVHPQSETYAGNVDPTGLRSAYGESLRFAEAAVAAASRSRGLDARIVRFFNCYGPSMTEKDGRLIPALVDAERTGQPFPIHGSGRQTRSLMFVSDAVELARLVMQGAGSAHEPVNAGSEDERTVEAIAQTFAAVAGVPYIATHLPARPHDPQRRQPDLTRARGLGWSPRTTLEDGLLATHRWFRDERLAFA